MISTWLLIVGSVAALAVATACGVMRRDVEAGAAMALALLVCWGLVACVVWAVESAVGVAR